jgi:hypothetical protein
LSNWKKLVASGSHAHLASVTASKFLADSITFTTTSGISVGVGELAWNNSDGTLDLGMKGGNVVQQIGQEIFYEVRNATGDVIENGTAVYESGVTVGSGRIIASPFTADGSVREVRFLGLATEDINNGVNGFVTNFGYVRGLDTRGTEETAISVGDEDWQVGDVLYAHPTVAGKLTNIPPKHKIYVAILIVRHQNVGVLFVKPSSYGHIDDIHDVSISTGSLSSGDLLVYDASSDDWKNSKQLTGSYGLTGSLQATSFTGSLQGTASYSVSSSYAVTSSFASSSPAVYDFGSFATPTDVGGGGNFGIVTDGDKGDITVTSSGSIWTIDNDAVTYAKIQNVTTSSVLLGRATTGAGNIEEIILGSGLTISGSTISAAGGGGGAQIQADIISGSGTWTKPSFAKKISVYLLPGGGGGGSGARQATTSNRCGGAGGAACGYISAFFNATFISSSVSVTIGAGGTTGSSVTADNTNGNNGGAGGVTSFGSYITTGQNGGGNGGATSSTSTGGTPFGAAGFLVPVTTFDGRSGTTSTGTSFLSSALGFNTMLGGAGGAGAAANITTTANGGQVTSSNWTTIFPTITFGTPGTNGGNGGNGSNNQIGNYLYQNTGGGGGSYKTGQVTGNGGDGGYGAGGGGGAASDNGFASGAGGKGGDGLCIVISEG